MNLPTSRIGLVEGRHPRPDEPRTSCGWCGRPSPHPTCQTCDSLDRRAQPTDSHALPDGRWVKRGFVWHYVADPVQPRFNECAQCGNRCRGQVCRDCWRNRARATAHAEKADEHGTHASYNRHLRNGERPCDDCRVAESEYQKPRYRARYAAKKRAKEAA